MKVSIKNNKNLVKGKKFLILKFFLKFIQKKLPLDKDVFIYLDENRSENMTTGKRNTGGIIHVLCKNRLLADILRTLSHEWVHEYEHQKLNVPEDSDYPDIGGPIENLANVLSGMMIKEFVRLHPDYETELFNSK